MTRYRLYAISNDEYWLGALSKLEGDDIHITTVLCSEVLPPCLHRLQEVDRQGLLLIDTGLPGEMAEWVHLAHAEGWQYVVAVAAAPHSDEARIVLQEGAFDYWKKTYVVSIIREQVWRWIAFLKQMEERASGARDGQTKNPAG